MTNCQLKKFQEKMKKVTHIINQLHPSGAEQMLLRLLKAFRDDNVKSDVIVLNNNFDNDFRKDFINEGINILILKDENYLNKFFRLVRILKKNKPDIVQTWMYEADLVGGFAARLANIKKVFWNVRSVRPSNHNIIFLKLIGIMSWLIPNKIISNSHKAINFKVKNFYNRNKFIYIPNGYALSSYNPARSIIEKYNSDIIFGSVARFDKTKSINVLLDAIAELQNSNIFPNFVFFGSGMTLDNKVLKNMILRRGINLEKIEFLGYRKSKDSIFNSFDVLCLTSNTESFPNVVFEGAIYGKVILSTKTGDLQKILPASNFLVEINSCKEIVDSIKSILASDNVTLQKIVKQNLEMIKRYDIYSISRKYYQLYYKI